VHATSKFTNISQALPQVDWQIHQGRKTSAAMLGQLAVTVGWGGGRHMMAMA